MDEYRMIDMKDFANFLSAFISFVKNILKYIIVSIRKYIVLAVLIFVVVVGAGYFYWHSRQQVYESQMVCMFNNLGKKTYGEVIRQLDNLAKTHSYNALSKTLNLPQDKAKAIIGIDGRNMAGGELYEDISSDRSPIYITVRSTDKTVFAPLQDALIYYLSNNSPFSQKSNETEMKIITKKMALVDEDMASIDSVISSYSTFLKNTQTDSTTGLANIAALLSYKEQLEDKETQMEWKKRELENNIELLHGFLPADYPSRGDSRKLFWGLFVSALLAASFIPVFYRLIKSSS